ncbi:TFIIEalpha/SarR/Rpc3 HTH domain [Dillenia turbinata]|uniref:TFIIEalpha/SarR/Rpc3 HTH domain n=1 Tax=Dillenia turbinata TaxID=194707 RepID=A0AAN8WEN3_9MAGN
MNHEATNPFKRLVKLAARAFYDDISTKGDNQPKTGRSDNRGLVVVVLDALTRRQWAREEDLAKELKLHSKQLRRTLRFLEEEKMVSRDHRKETAKGAKMYNAAIAATTDGQQNGKEHEEKIKLHTHSYCCLDYAQIYDVVRYRIHRLRKKIKDELEDKNTVQEYICPNCGKRYNALDALRLVSMDDEDFHCESCNAALVAESDKLAAQDIGDGDDNARRRRREKLKDMLQKMEIQLKPLTEQLNRVKDLPVPEYRGLQAWEAQASASARATHDDANGSDSFKSAQGQGFGGTPMPYFGETKVEVSIYGLEPKEEDAKSNNASTPMKVLPPWMIKQGMVLTSEQRGEVKQEMKMEGSSTKTEILDDKKSSDEYLKAYYAAVYKMQQERAVQSQQESSNAENVNNGDSSTSNRVVGMKSKRQDDDGDDDVDWEEVPTAGNATENFKVNDLNVQAAASDIDEDDVDWEEG